MPYGKLWGEHVQRFAEAGDFKKHKTTIEEEEEYQPWIDHGFVIYAGFDYKGIVKQAEKEADVLIFDGGNNDLPFIKPDVLIVVADPHRPGHELTYYPGYVNLLMADIVVVNKVDSAEKKNVDLVVANIKRVNPKAKIVLARSELVVDKPKLIKGKKCLVVGDGPTLSHGEMPYGVGSIAVKKFGGKFVSGKKSAVGYIKETFEKFKHLDMEVPAMGYSGKQISDLRKTIDNVKCDVVVDGTPANLQRLMKINKPWVTVDYELGSKASGMLKKLLRRFL
jgi:predicted GTPase